MTLPLFYVPVLNKAIVELDEETSKHLITVLRKKKNEEIFLTDGKGLKAFAIIVDDNRKKCKISIIDIIKSPEIEPKITVAISLIKNVSRFEWF